MRYIKVLFLVLVFFVCMIFFFQNQATLSQDMVFKIDSFGAMELVAFTLPMYIVVLTAFLIGAVLAITLLAWDRMHLSARLMKSTWRVRNLEKELGNLKASLSSEPQSTFRFFRKKKATRKEEAAPAEEVSTATEAE